MNQESSEQGSSKELSVIERSTSEVIRDEIQDLNFSKGSTQATTLRYIGCTETNPLQELSNDESSGIECMNETNWLPVHKSLFQTQPKDMPTDNNSSSDEYESDEFENNLSKNKDKAQPKISETTTSRCTIGHTGCKEPKNPSIDEYCNSDEYTKETSPLLDRSRIERQPRTTRTGYVEDTRYTRYNTRYTEYQVR